jgi:hypothetical protein
MLRLGLAMIAVASFVACAGSAKREASILVAAVDRYRRADSTSKLAEARTVAAVACTDAKVCGAKRACVAALDPTARALTLKDEVARRVDDLQAERLAPDSPEAQALPGKLDEAEKLLREGRTKMPDCEKQLTDLQVEYGG